MVFGIGEGKLEITTDKQTYLPGEIIKGQITLTLSNPKKAKELRVKFYGEYNKSSGRNSSVERIYEVNVSLDSEKEYSAGTKIYEYQIQIPQIKRAAATGEGIMGNIMNIITTISDPIPRAIWYVDASLDLPMSFDINKRIRINLQV